MMIENEKRRKDRDIDKTPALPLGSQRMNLPLSMTFRFTHILFSGLKSKMQS